MNKALGAIRRTAAILHRLRYERISFQWQPVEDLSIGVADGVRWLAAQTLGDETQPAFFCHPPGSVTYRFNARPGDRVIASCGLLREAWNRNLGGAEFTITIRNADGATLHETRRLVNPGTQPDDRRWCHMRVAIPVRRAEAVTLTFSTRVPEWYAGDSAWAVWGRPAAERRRSADETSRLLRELMQRLRARGVRLALRELGLAGYIDERTPEYRAWIAARTPSTADLERMRAHSRTLTYRPTFSIITPVYNTPPELLRACAASVMAQVYDDWEWCICDDASPSEATKAALRELSDPRIRITSLAANSGICGASQAALELATGEFIALLDHDDELTPDALYRMACRLNDRRDADVLYSDEDKRDEDGGLSEPFYKPDWSPEHLLSSMYTCHLTVARRGLVERVGGFRKGMDGAQDHDLMLRLADATARIEHVPHVLYHWRRTPGSTAAAITAKPWAESAGRRALEDFLRRNQLGTDVDPGAVPGVYRPRFAIAGQPNVLVVITGDSDDARSACADRVRSRTPYANYSMAFAFPACAEINAAVREHESEFVVFLDANVDPDTDGWLEAMLEFAQQPLVGAVGAKILYGDGRVRHIGLVLGCDEGIGRALHRHLEPHGYFASTLGTRNYSAVSGEALMTRRELFDAAGGFDEQLAWNVADVDYCLKQRQAGRRVVFTPFAEFRLRQSASPLADADAIASLRAKWGGVVDADPYYNPNLSRARADYELSS